MREVDRRSKYDRRIFLQGAAATVPVAAIAASTGLGVEDAWADDATTLAPDAQDPGEGRARYLSARFLVDSYYITAMKPWDAKAAKDPKIKALVDDGVSRLDQDAKIVTR